MGVKRFNGQPPSGGCVLKQRMAVKSSQNVGPAAFGRLCVETQFRSKAKPQAAPAAFGRLCVETGSCWFRRFACFPAAFGRLCVETYLFAGDINIKGNQPPSGGCVLKPQ